MEILLIILLALALAGDAMLGVALYRLNRRDSGGRDDELLRTVQETVEQETEVLADQLRAVQGEVGRTTVSSVRDLGAMLAESQRQSGQDKMQERVPRDGGLPGDQRVDNIKACDIGGRRNPGGQPPQHRYDRPYVAK